MCFNLLGINNLVSDSLKSWSRWTKSIWTRFFVLTSTTMTTYRIPVTPKHHTLVEWKTILYRSQKSNDLKLFQSTQYTGKLSILCKITFILFYMYVGILMSLCSHGDQRKTSESVLSFHFSVGPSDGMQLIRLGSKHLYWISNLPSPSIHFMK